MKNVLLLLFLFVSFPSWAQTEDPEKSKVNLSFPVLDLPYNAKTYFPNYYSMRQSLHLSTSFYEGMHYWVGPNPWKILAVDFIATYLPLGDSWMHEEWHRSVMTNRGIGSFNDVNLIPFGAEIIAVSHVDDQDLVRLKSDHPADQVRLSSAGMESQVAQNQLVERHHFFDEIKTKDQILLWMNSISVTSYLYTCSTTEADKTTDEQNREDGIDISRRDFTGLDCNAWVYDLFRPDEPYTARGTHPSGVGIDRYIRYSDLNDKEKEFLQRQTSYSLVNFVDPFLFGKDEFSASWKGQSFKWNARLAHFLTSFGATIDSILFLKTETEKFALTWHHGMTDTRYLPGLSFEWLDKQLPLQAAKMSLGLTVWQQPRGQRVEESAQETVVRSYSELKYRHNQRWSSFYGLDLKTPGWIAGNPYLDRNLSLYSGVLLSLY